MGAVCLSLRRRIHPVEVPPPRPVETNKVRDTVSRSSVNFRYKTRLNLPESSTEEGLLQNANVALHRFCYPSFPMEMEIPLNDRIVS